ncbi:heme ABC transporter ATP-binding protein [Psychromonas sp. RZ22]|uniref:heme ABC transporter ATP-binding protein n=1 Tax=Psychromonas algarum TaxID=2555643 RepID=UPI001068C97E|nr:heme ABC transporter ATP-binding protein [Psychromonas sp. RZ22]TEW54157.1 heme ABC transporter ATP-binding protein [Psychromonas sp. RZ22]
MANLEKNAISIQNLSLSLGNKQILNNLSVEIKSNQVTALLGPNGAGKSSLLKCLSRELSVPKNTQLKYFEHSITDWPKNLLPQHLAVLAQQSSLTFAFTVQEVIELGLLPLNLSTKQAKKVVRENMVKVGVENLADRLYPTLSGGEKQRVHLARVLTQLNQSKDKTILMLDEPTSALDLAHQHNTLKLAKQLAYEGAAVIIVLHDLNLAAQYADRVLVLADGEIKADGTPWNALTSNMIEKVYGQKTLIEKHPISDYPVIHAA